MTCAVCGATFNGRPNRQYCSTVCRRELERRRRAWDKRAAAVAPGGIYDLNTNMPGRTERQRAHWQSKWDEARASLSDRP